MYTSIENVRPCDVDPYGIMHHSIYLQMYENAVFGYLRDTLNIKDQYPVIRSADIKYVKSAYMGDVLEVSTELKETSADGKTLLFKQKIQNGKILINRGVISVELNRIKGGNV